MGGLSPLDLGTFGASKGGLLFVYVCLTDLWSFVFFSPGSLEFAGSLELLDLWRGSSFLVFGKKTQRLCFFVRDLWGIRKSSKGVLGAEKAHDARISPDVHQLGPPAVPFLTPFFGEGSPTKIDDRKKGSRYSNLSTGGPSQTRTIGSPNPLTEVVSGC